MDTKIAFICLLLSSPATLACFNDSGCPKGNVCVKTGNLLGVCMGQAIPGYGNSLTTPTTSTTTTTTITTPAGNTATTVATPSSGVQVQLPPVPAAQPKIAGQCLTDLNCSSGFVCSKPSGNYYGICTQVSQ